MGPRTPVGVRIEINYSILFYSILFLADSQPTSSCAKQWAGELLQRTAGIPQEGREYNLLFLALT